MQNIKLALLLLKKAHMTKNLQISELEKVCTRTTGTTEILGQNLCKLEELQVPVQVLQMYRSKETSR